jgi:phosphoribosyl 1,2-cyclic phosphodiesterase
LRSAPPPRSRASNCREVRPPIPGGRLLNIHVLASGSKGNCALLEAGGTSVLIDAGLSGSEIERRIGAVGADVRALSGILITHEHADHVRGAGILARRYGIPVYLTKGTHEAEQKHLGELPQVRHVRPGHDFELGALGIRAFSTPHTSQSGRHTHHRERVADPVAYVFFNGSVKAGYATDLGHPIALMNQHLAGCRLLVLEFNHDPALLVNGPYPWPVKQWIKGQGGHLSNEQGAQLLEAILRHDLQLEALVLAHLSETNNTPELARAAAHGVLKRFRVEQQIALHVAGPDAPVTVTVHR